MRKIKMLLVILGLVFISSCIHKQEQEYRPGSGQFKPGSEPDGFRGIKWETDINTLSDMVYRRTDPGYGGIQIYTRKNDELKIGNATLSDIEYSFLGGKFCDVYIFIEGRGNYANLKDTVFEKFGVGYQEQEDEYIERYVWFGKNTGMSLEYNKSSEVGFLHMFSKKMYQYKEEYDKQKAKEGAEKGF